MHWRRGALVTEAAHGTEDRRIESRQGSYKVLGFSIRKPFSSDDEQRHLHTPTYICTYTYTYLHMYIYICLPTYVHIHTPTYICTYTYTYLHMYIYIYLPTYVHIQYLPTYVMYVRE
jgi:hypothetical protein